LAKAQQTFPPVPEKLSPSLTTKQPEAVETATIQKQASTAKQNTIETTIKTSSISNKKALRHYLN
jgi:hypothetical protein